MADVQSDARDEEQQSPIVLRKPMQDEVEMDITPMIDIVFLLLIFFLVCSTAASQMEVELPKARHGKGVSEQDSVVFSVETSGGEGPVVVYSEQTGKLPDDPEAQEDEIRAEIELGMASGRPYVIVKAAKDVQHKDVSRVAAAVGRVEGVRLYMAVLEAH